MLRLAASVTFLFPWSLEGAVEFVSHPPCRKSPELHSLVWPGGEEKLVAFGGKGFIWKCKGKGCQENAPELLLARRALPEAAQSEAAVREEDGEEDGEEDVEEESDLVGNFTDEGGLSLSARRLKKRKRRSMKPLKRNLKRKVSFLGDTWAFSSDSDEWEKVWLQSDHAQAPTPRWKPSSTVTDDKRHMILFGGCKSTFIGGVMNDLWVFQTMDKGGQWTRVYTQNPPSKRRGHIAAANSTHLVVMGGKSYDMVTKKASVNIDLWSIPLASLAISGEEPASAAEPGKRGFSLDATLTGKSGQSKGLLGAAQWTQGTNFPGAPRWGATGEVLKGSDGREMLAVFGGRHLNKGGGFHSVDTSAYTYYNELWLYDFQAGNWSMAEPRGPMPHARDHHGATEMHGKLYVFGGRVEEIRSADAVRNDLWSYSLDTGSWTLHEAQGGFAPSSRYMPGVSSTIFKGKGAIAIFGGEFLPGSTKKTSLNDVWIYDGTKWHEASPSDCSADATGLVLKAGRKERVSAIEMLSEGLQAPPIALIAAAFFIGLVAIVPRYMRRGLVAQEAREPQYLMMD